MPKGGVDKIKLRRCAFCPRTLHTTHNKALGVCYYCEKEGKRVENGVQKVVVSRTQIN